MVDVRIDLYQEPSAGTHAVSVDAAPQGVASPDDVPAVSATITWDDAGNGAAATAPAETTLSFRRAVASPVGLAPLHRDPPLLYVYMYHPRDAEEILAFDARITDEYTAYYGERGVHYCGTFHVEGGPLGSCIGEIITFDTADRAEAERWCTEGLSERIVAIEDECRTLQDRARPRYVLWLQRSSS
jgi:hypothetical protein